MVTHMAVEVRGLTFSMDDSAPDFVVPGTYSVPAVRTFRGVVTGNNGPVLLVEGDWAAESPETMTYSWVRRQDLPWSPGAGEVCVGAWHDTSLGFNGIAVEAPSV